MGGTQPRADLYRRAELSGDGSAGHALDGAVERDWGFVGGAEGSGGDEAWGVFGVDRYVVFSSSFSSFVQVQVQLLMRIRY